MFSCSPIQKKKNWFKEAFPTDAKSMKLLPSGPLHFLLWLPYLSFFSYKPQQRQESFLPEAISMLHHCALLSRRELISLTSNSTQGHSPGLLTSSAAKEEPRLPPLCTIRFRKCSPLEAGLLSFPGQCLAPWPQLPMAPRTPSSW